MTDERQRPQSGCAGTLAVMLAVACCAGAVCAQTLTFDSREVTAATAALQAWQAENPSGWWSWGITGWDQNEDGKTDLYVNTHSQQGGTLLRQGATLADWTDVTASLGQTRNTMPAENRPSFFDINNDGHIDIAANGDESVTYNRLNRVDSLETTAGRTIFSGGVSRDVNEDGWMDYETFPRSWGSTIHRVAYNRWPVDGKFQIVDEPAPYPTGLPQAIVDELDAKKLVTAIYNRYMGPLFHDVDLNGDGLQDLVIQYGGSYGGARFGRYLLRLPDASLVDVTATCGIPGNLMPLFPIRDASGDGKPDVLAGYGSTSTTGLYRQVEPEASDLPVPAIKFALRKTDNKHLNSTADLWPAIYAPPYIPEVHWIDFDKDGDDDLLIATRRYKWVGIWEQRGGDLHRVLKAPSADADGWFVDDINKDGMIDLITFGGSAQTDVTVRFHLNTSPIPGPVDPPPATSSLLVKVDGVARPAGTTVKIDGVLVPLPATGVKLIEVEAPADPVDPTPPPADLIPITPETIDQVEKSPPGKSYKLAPGTYRAILLKDRKDVRVYGGDGVLFKGRYASPYGSTVVLERCEGVHLEGLQATEGNCGFAIYRSKFCGVKDCEAFGNKNQGIFASFSTDGYVTNCHTHHQTDQHGVYISNDGHRWKITGVESHHNGRSGIQFNGDKYADGEGLCRDNVIENCNIHDNAGPGINLDGFVNGKILNTKVIGDIRLFKIDGALPSSGNLIKDCNIRQTTKKGHGVLMRDGAVNRIEDTVIALETPSLETWYFPISVERGKGSDYSGSGNTLSGPSAKPIGGGTYGKTAEDLAPGDTSTFVRIAK